MDQDRTLVDEEGKAEAFRSLKTQRSSEEKTGERTRDRSSEPRDYRCRESLLSRNKVCG